eukprot:scaffold84203_cov21-Tisochrysis_lutea.AAC.1
MRASLATVMTAWRQSKGMRPLYPLCSVFSVRCAWCVASVVCAHMGHRRVCGLPVDPCLTPTITLFPCQMKLRVCHSKVCLLGLKAGSGPLPVAGVCVLEAQRGGC